MTQNKPCPIPGCRRKWRVVNGLRSHLYMDHNKAELIEKIIASLENRDLYQLEEVTVKHES